ncbi:MAG: dTMP kinase [Candidatus Bathyarchaeota archaeon]|nr:MAG: dTMP kinase [Candidatus Bathyarchaeota archaeon]
MADRGVFIVFEGIDGSGKDTHIKFLLRELRERGYNVVETAEPSKNRVGTFLKRYQRRDEGRLPAETEALIFAGDRFDHLKTVVEPALKRGAIVISNRYFYSSLAYQGAMGVDLDWIREMNRFARKPDLVVLLDILPEFSLQRLKRQRTIYERTEYLRKVRDIYVQLVNTGELVSVDADRPKKAVQAELLELLEGLLEAREG